MTTIGSGGSAGARDQASAVRCHSSGVTSSDVQARGLPVVLAHGCERRAVRPAVVAREQAARGERAGVLDQRRRRGVAPQRRELVALVGVEPEARLEQRRAVRVRGVGDDLLDGAGFDDPPAVDDGDPVGHGRRHREIVGDEHEGGAAVAAELADQLEDLGLDRDVERRRRLVGEHQHRLAGHRHRDHHPLALTAGELVRVRADPARRLGDPHPLEPRLGRPVVACRLGELPAHPHGRVERGHRVLEDRAHPLAPDAAQRGVRRADDLGAVDEDGARHLRPRGRGEQALHREAQRRFPRPALADERDDLAAGDVEVDAPQRVDDLVALVEADLEVTDGQRRRTGVVALLSLRLSPDHLSRPSARLLSSGSSGRARR